MFGQLWGGTWDQNRIAMAFGSLRLLVWITVHPHRVYCVNAFCRKSHLPKFHSSGFEIQQLKITMGLFHKEASVRFSTTWHESSQEPCAAQVVCEMQQALAGAELLSVITGVITTGQRRLLRILQGTINIFSSALKATVKLLLSCKQPKTGVNNDFQSLCFLCGV